MEKTIYVLIRETDAEPSQYLGVFKSPEEAAKHIKNDIGIEYYNKETTPIKFIHYKGIDVFEHDLGYGAFVLYEEKIRI